MSKTNEAGIENAKDKLVAKIAAIILDIGKVKPAGKNTFHNYSYTTEGQVMAELKTRMASRGVAMFTSIESIETKVIKNRKDQDENLVTITTLHTFADSETATSFSVKGAGQGVDPGDKGVYKAITGATKYVLMKNFMMTDANDPEADDGTDKRNAEKPHSRFREYEEETGRGDTAAAADLATMREFMEKEEVPEAFVMTLAKKGKLATDAQVNIGDLKPGSVTRLLALRETILERWADAKNRSVESNGTEKKPSKAREMAAKNKSGVTREHDASGETDQTAPGARVPYEKGITPKEYLESEGVEWRDVEITFGKKKGTKLGSMEDADIAWWINNWVPKPFKGKMDDDSITLDMALCEAQRELGVEEA